MKKQNWKDKKKQRNIENKNKQTNKKSIIERKSKIYNGKNKRSKTEKNETNK